MNFNKRSTGEPGGVTGIDVAGHELTHGVTQETCGLNYSFESGAMNESLSDIMGKSVQFVAKPNDINWQMSNDMNWIIRDLSNPNAQGQPDTYKGNLWYTGSGDNGGVHYNSGVGNFMFYLLVNGGTGTNDKGSVYTVTGIGLSKADQIIYRTQSVYLVPTSQYADWRTAAIAAVGDLYGGASPEANSVKNAFYAVGIGTDSTGCEAPSGLGAINITTTSATLKWAHPAQV
jgi:Zn-dependent metalloprotease